ncbi:MAG: heavy-metal-associated domain-containing protein [Roseburia sp.]
MKMNFATIIVIILVILIVGACLFSFFRRMTGKKSCCETSAQRVKPKKLKAPIGSFTLKIEGMRCESCRRTLMARLNELNGISAKVSLENKIAVISYEHHIDDEEIVEVVEKAGFEVIEINH